MSASAAKDNSRRTRIIVTLGPASRERGTLERLIAEGVDYFRFNFSHSTHVKHARCLKLVRELTEAAGRFIPCIQDLQGPKVRVGDIGAGLPLKVGDKVLLTGLGEAGGAGWDRDRDHLTIPLDYPGDLPRLEPGQKIWLDEGNLLLRTLRPPQGRARAAAPPGTGTFGKVPARSIPCKVELGGTLLSRKAVHMPGVEMEAPILDESDLADLEFGLDQGFDMVAVSYVRNARDLGDVKAAIQRRQAQGRATPGHGKTSRPITLISKIETASAVLNLESIARASDELWVARGDLGMEMPLEQVPILQKQIVARCHAQNKPVAIATQLLESMLEHRRPTRAEATDVANAIFDGADGLLLSGETAVGQHPVEAVQWLERLVQEAEEHPEYLLSRSGSG